MLVDATSPTHSPMGELVLRSRPGQESGLLTVFPNGSRHAAFLRTHPRKGAQLGVNERVGLKSTFEVETRCSSAMCVVHRIDTIVSSFS